MTAPVDEPVSELAATMEDETIGSIVITDGEPVGIVTDHELAIQGLAAHADPDELVAGDVMSDGLQTIAAELLADEQQELATVIQAQRPPS